MLFFSCISFYLPYDLSVYIISQLYFRFPDANVIDESFANFCVEVLHRVNEYGSCIQSDLTGEVNIRGANYLIQGYSPESCIHRHH